MKTKELIKRLERIDDIYVRLRHQTINVFSHSGFYMFSIPIKATNWLDLKINSNPKLPDKHKDGAEALIGAYLGTPLDERGEDKKYTVQVFKEDESGYLAQDVFTDRFMIDDLDYDDEWHNIFTQAEIDKFKQRDDLAIDWDKAIIKEVHDDE